MRQQTHEHQNHGGPVEETSLSISDATLSMVVALESLHRRLQGADGVTIGNEHTTTKITMSENATLTHIAESAHRPIIASVARMMSSLSE